MWLDALRPSHLSRYKDLARLLAKYGRSDLVSQAGMSHFVDAKVSTAADEAAEGLATDLEHLGPTYIKLGQVLATRPDLLPPAYIKALARLHDKVEAFSYEKVEQVFIEEIGVDPAKAFAAFDRQPLAAASIGQVHAAVMQDGRGVVVKVQRPGIQEQVRTDLQVLQGMADLLEEHTEVGRRFRVVDIIRDFRKTMMRELDYLSEAENLLMLRHNMQRFEKIVIPKPIDTFTSMRVLTMERVNGVKATEIDETRAREIDGIELADHVLRAYLSQVLEDGFYHADPHPGNVILTPDDRVGLIDLGMVGYVGPTMREHLLQLLLAVSEGRSDDAAAVAIEASELLDDFNETRFRQDINDIVAHQHNASLQEMNMGRMLMEVCRVSGESGLIIPSSVMMVGKTMLNLDGIGRSLDPDFNPNESIRKYAAHLARRQFLSKLTPGHLYNQFVEAARTLENLPQQFGRIMTKLSSGKLRLKIDAIDEDRLIGGMQKIANRITVGLVLAGLIVGAAVMMHIETGLTIFGYPVIAMFCFLTAATLGFIVVIGSLWSDR